MFLCTYSSQWVMESSVSKDIRIDSHVVCITTRTCVNRSLENIFVIDGGVAGADTGVYPSVSSSICHHVQSTTHCQNLQSQNPFVYRRCQQFYERQMTRLYSSLTYSVLLAIGVRLKMVNVTIW